MSYSPAFVQAVLQENTEDVFLFLLTLDHADLAQPIRLVNNIESVTSRGNLYSAFPFELVLPQDDGETLPEVIISMSNVTLELIEDVRTLQGALSVTVEIILSDSPDYVEMSIEGMKTNNISYDAQRLQATCQVEDVLNLAFPQELYLPSNFPGLFQ
jgi:hypothetical protein